MKRWPKAFLAVGVILASFAAGSTFLVAWHGRADWVLAMAIIALAIAQILFWAQPRGVNFAPFIQALRRELQALMGRVQEIEANFNPTPPEPEAKQVREHVMDLFLEPVIAFGESLRQFYRASLAMRGPKGAFVDVDVMEQGAEAVGMRPMLEFITLRRSLDIAEVLQERGRAVNVFCPVSAASFASSDFILRAQEAMQMQPEADNAIIFEIAESGMADLTDEGMNGLAQLSELGANFCLAEARGRGAGPAILMGLGIRYISLHTQLLLSGEAALYVADCRRAGLAIIAAQVESEQAAAHLQGQVDYAYGSFYAAPRMVRADLKAA